MRAEKRGYQKGLKKNREKMIYWRHVIDRTHQVRAEKSRRLATMGIFAYPPKKVYSTKVFFAYPPAERNLRVTHC